MAVVTHEVHLLQGYINQDDNVADAEMAGGESTSMFGSLNQRLVAAGIPTWHIATYSVEPIVSVGFLLSFLLAGFRGLLFSAVLFFVVKYSRFGTSENRGRNTSAATSNSNRPAPSAPSAARGNWPRDGGHRLGYS